MNNKMCAYPDCKNIADSRGSRIDGGKARFKWCRYHRRGNGKKERLNLTPNNQL